MVTNAPTVIEIVRRMKDGSTEPFLCQCDDGNLYVVKSKPKMTPKELVAEFVAAHLASDVGLSIPDFCIVDVPGDLIEYSPELRGEINEGYAFASRFIDGAIELSFTQAHNESVVSTPEQKKIYLFDRWVLNADRSLTKNGGNVNMLFDVVNNKYYLIDHNLSFDHSDRPDDFAWHVYCPASRKWIFDLVDREAGESLLRDVIARFASFTQLIPEDWLNSQDLVPFIVHTLDRATTDDFWSKIV